MGMAEAWGIPDLDEIRKKCKEMIAARPKVYLGRRGQPFGRQGPEHTWSESKNQRHKRHDYSMEVFPHDFNERT
jgi:hypothetical protein